MLGASQVMAFVATTDPSRGLPGQDQAGVWTTGDGTRVAWFKDPDGNLLSLTQF